MNTRFKPFAILLLALCFGLLLPGCRRAEDFFYQKKVIEIPAAILATNTVYTTNVVVTAAVTNVATGELISPPRITQTVVPTVTYEYSPVTYRTNLVPRPSIDGGLEVVGALPVPFAGTAAVVLGWAVHAYAAFRNKKRSDAVAESLITGIEAGRRAIRETPEGLKLDSVIKAKLKDSQIANGVWPAVRNLVGEYVPDSTHSVAPNQPHFRA